MTAKLLPELHNENADELMVELASAAMMERLDEKRSEGAGGWHTENCTNDSLYWRLRASVENGKWVDVLNYAGMILARTDAGYEN